MKIPLLIFVLFMTSNRLLAEKLRIDYDTLILVDVFVFKKLTKEQATNISYFKINDRYFDAVDNYPFPNFGCVGTTEDSLNTQIVLKMVNEKREKRFLRKSAKAKSIEYSKCGYSDDLLECLLEQYRDHVIFVSLIKVVTRYAVLNCQFDFIPTPSLICPQLFKKNEWVVPISYDKIL